MKFRILFVFLSFLFFNCSIKKHHFLSRNYHKIKTSYNGLFYANKAYENAFHFLIENKKKSLEKIKKKEVETNKDIQTGFFPIENLVENQKNYKDLVFEKFDKVEKKLLNLIKDHSIIFKGKQYNDKMAEIYLLLGSSRYFQEKYLLALESFTNFLREFKNHSLEDKIEFWEAKTYLELEEYNLSKNKVAKILKRKKISKKLKKDLHDLNTEISLKIKVLNEK